MKKPTGFMSNSPELLRYLEKRCHGKAGQCSRPSGGTHRICCGTVARHAAIFHQEMCETILKGMKAQMVIDGTYRRGEAGANIVMMEGDDEVCACYDAENAPPLRPGSSSCLGVVSGRKVPEQTTNREQKKVKVRQQTKV